MEKAPDWGLSACWHCALCVFYEISMALCARQEEDDNSIGKVLPARSVPPQRYGMDSVTSRGKSLRHATAWIVAHQLESWSFQFDHATTRAGCCNYRTRVISLAHAYARSAADEAIDNTLLHEIAHALVGKTHGHDQVWQARAVALGCSGQRCHDGQFTPPLCIITCDKACWVTTAERRQRGAVCRTCHGQVHYTTYTEDRWQQATTRS
jgi:hypothetical protein